MQERTADDPGPTSPDGPPPARLPAALLAGTWALALTGLVQPVLAVVSVVQVLGGRMDTRYFSSYSYDAAGVETVTARTDVTFWERWDVVTWQIPLDRALLAGAAVAVALAGLHLAGRGRWRLPLPLRLVSALTATLTAVSAAANVLVVLVGTQSRPGEESSYGWPSEFAALATPTATAAAVAVFSAVAVVVLLGPAAPAPVVVAPAPAPAPAPAERAPVPPVHAGPAPAGAAHDDTAGPRFPRPSEEESAWYRRPTT